MSEKLTFELMNPELLYGEDRPANCPTVFQWRIPKEGDVYLRMSSMEVRRVDKTREPAEMVPRMTAVPLEAPTEPWSMSPEFAGGYIAMDISGIWYWYGMRPIRNDDQGIWIWDHDVCEIDPRGVVPLCALKIDTPLIDDWTESLRVCVQS